MVEEAAAAAAVRLAVAHPVARPVAVRREAVRAVPAVAAHPLRPTPADARVQDLEYRLATAVVDTTLAVQRRLIPLARVHLLV